MENLDNVDKHIRKIRKKLRQIERLEVIDRPLNPEEQLKVDSKGDLRTELHQLLEEYRKEDFNLIKQPAQNRYGSEEEVSGEESEEEEEESSSCSEKTDRSCPQKEDKDLATEGRVEDEATTRKGDRSVDSRKLSDFTKPEGPEKVLKTDTGSKDRSNPWKDSAYWVYTLEGHNDIILDVDIFQDYIISSSRDTTVKVWKIGNDKELWSLRGHHTPVTSVSFLPTSLANVLCDIMVDSSSGATDESHIFAVSGALDCMLKVWDVVTGECLKSIYTYNGITCIACGPQYVVTGTEGGRLEVWCLMGQRLAYVDAFTSRVAKLKIFEDKLYAGSVDGDIGIWEISVDGKNLTSVFSLVPDGSSQLVLNELYAMVVNKNVLLLGDNGPNIKGFTWTTGVVEKYANHIGDIGMTDALTITPDNYILSASYFVDGGYPSINVRSADTMEYVCTITDLWEGRILCLAATEGVFVSGGHYLKVWVQKSKHERPYNSEQADIVLTSFVKELTNRAQDSGTDESDWTVSEDEGESFRRFRSLKHKHSKESSWWCTMV